ncbi:APC family permease [Nonomuraea sp. NPDC050556]|uniref:APC family permease n=1 Tax=Nonomuraea sp. NPDC050556 TaxID=3364369 RepID=UPI00379ADB56
MALTPPTSRRLPGSEGITNALAASRLGPGAVLFFVLSAAAPLTVVAGVISTGYAVTGITGLPIAFLVVGVVLAVFAVGYVAMARKIANAGAFYTYITHGLGRPAGVAAAWVALLTYNTLQVGLYGGIGAAAAPLLEQWLGLTVPWWVFALVSWALVGWLGLARVDINGKVLATLLSGEVVVIVIFDLAGLFHPAADFALSSLSPAGLAVPGVGALLVIAVLGFVGFEASVVYSEESRDPERTVPTATYTAIGLIAALYALSAWAMQVATGPGRIIEVARRDGAETIFVIAAAHLSPLLIDIARVLFVTSVFAAMLAVHNTTARYFFALGREGVLPVAFGRTVPRTGAPRAGSLLQSGIGLLVILVWALFAWDPVVSLFFAGGTLGGLGVLVLTTATAFSVVAYFRRNPGDVSAARRLWAPLAAAVALTVTLWLAVTNVSTLLGVPDSDPLVWILPSAYAVAAAFGFVWALGLRMTRPDVYSQVGLGATAQHTGTPR